MRPVSWQELRKVCLRLSPDVLNSNLRTLGISKEELLRLLDEI